MARDTFVTTLYLAYTIPHLKWQVPELGEYADKDWPEEHFKIQAAMDSRMDRDIGRIKHLLEKLGIAENTLIMFNSDNGAHALGGFVIKLRRSFPYSYENVLIILFTIIYNSVY